MSWGAQISADKPAYDSAETMIARLDKCTESAIGYFLRNLKANGQIANETDLGSYGKLPNALIFAGYPKEANMVLNYVVDNFYEEESGDFVTRPGLKSAKKPFCIFYPYLGQWLIQSGLKLRRFDFVFKAAEFMDAYYDPVMHCSTIIAPYNENGGNIHGIFNSAALGTTYLYLNKLERAKKIGDTIIRMFSKQPDINGAEKIYYLRFDDNGDFIKMMEDVPGVRNIYKVMGTRVRQPWFSIGYPAAFLGQLYKATGDDRYLAGAESFLQYALRCNSDLRNNQWAHKTMWASSVVGSITNKKEYWDLCYDIANCIMNAQDPDTGKTSAIIDQTAEMAFWTPIISMNIRATVRKFGAIGTGTQGLKAKL